MPYELAVHRAEGHETRGRVGGVGRHVDDVVQRLEGARLDVLGHLARAGQAGEVGQQAGLDAGRQDVVDVAGAGVLDLGAGLVLPWLHHRHERLLLGAGPRPDDGDRAPELAAGRCRRRRALAARRRWPAGRWPESMPPGLALEPALEQATAINMTAISEPATFVRRTIRSSMPCLLSRRPVCPGVDHRAFRRRPRTCAGRSGPRRRSRRGADDELGREQRPGRDLAIRRSVPGVRVRRRARARRPAAGRW